MKAKVLMSTRSLRVELSPHREDPDRSVLVVTRTTRNGAARTLLVHTDELEEFADAVCEAADIVCPEDGDDAEPADGTWGEPLGEMTWGSAVSGGGGKLASTAQGGGNVSASARGRGCR